MFLAKIGVEYPAAQNVQSLPNNNLIAWPRQAVAARLSARAGDKASAAQDPHQLANVSGRNSLSPADLGDHHAASLALAAYAEQAAVSVFFVGADFHFAFPLGLS